MDDLRTDLGICASMLDMDETSHSPDPNSGLLDDIIFNELVCNNCQNNIIGLFEEQDDNDLYTCRSCGIRDIERRGMSYEQVQNSKEISSILDSLKPIDISCKRHTGGKSYKRRFHFIERVRQYYCLEPKIPEENLSLIRLYSDKLRLLDYFYNARFQEKIRLKKSNIQHLLRFMNSKVSNPDKYLVPNFKTTNLRDPWLDSVDSFFEFKEVWWCEKPIYKSKSFTTYYLEKWKSIAMFLQPDAKRPFRFLDVRSLAKLNFKFEVYSNTWEEMRQDGHIPEEKRKGGHFPNFNRTIMKICKEEKIPMDPDEFPVPKTKKTEDNLGQLYNMIRKRTVFGIYDEDEPKKKQTKVSDFFKKE